MEFLRGVADKWVKERVFMGVARKHELNVQGDPRELGEFAYKVLLGVAEHRYEEAIAAIHDYKKGKVHPIYQARTHRVFEHCEELVLAIKAKKTFPNILSLPSSKQEELHERAKAHWDELRTSLRRVRIVEKGIMLEDARSTIWVIKTFVYAVFIVLTFALLWEAWHTTLAAPVIMYVQDLGEKIMALFGF